MIPSAFAQENTIPDWVKGIAGWWAEDNISESEFINAMEFLVTEEIIKPTIVTELQNQVSDLQEKLDSAQKKISSLEQQLSELGTIPSDVDDDVSEPDLNTEKGIALAWTNGQINDTQYIQKMQNLLDDGTIPIDDINPQYDYSSNLQTIQSYIVTVKATTAAWTNGQISDSEYRQEQINYLFNNSILSTPERHIAKLWSNGKITDSQFIQQYQELIDKEIIKSFEGQAGTYNPNQPIPTWVKNNAGWWAGGSLSDNSYRDSIIYLYKNVILRNPLN